LEFVMSSVGSPIFVVPSASTLWIMIGVRSMGSMPLLQLPPLPMALRSILYNA
jgi:hypothetical protein